MDGMRLLLFFGQAAACGILEPMPPAVEAPSLKHWTIQGSPFPPLICYLILILYLNCLSILKRLQGHKQKSTKLVVLKEDSHPELMRP